MKNFLVLLMSLILVSGVSAADLQKAEAEGKVNFYANITAIEPIMDDFNASHKIEGIYTRISTSKYLATVLTESSVLRAGKNVTIVRFDGLPTMPVMQIIRARFANAR